jgi:hypothetical protein
MIYSAYQAAFTLLINTSNQLVAYTPSGGATSAIIIGTTSFTITANTWYSFTTIYQASGVCSFYVNNSLIGTTTNVGGTGTLTSTQFSLGTYDTSLANAFNGYIDDFEIYHFAAPNVVNPRIYLPMEGSTTDVMGGSTPVVTGSVSYLPGVIGSQALRIVNPPGGTAVNYVRATCSPGTNFTMGLWFNLQAYPDVSSGSTKIVILGTTADGIFNIDVTSAGALRIQTYRTGAVVDTYAISTISINTWYHLYLIFQQSGTSLAYLNGVQMLSYTGPTLFSAITTMTIGTNQIATQAFNG